MWAAMSVTFIIVQHLTLVGKSFGHEAQGIFLAGTFLVLLGMADDRFQLDALTKLAGQALAAGILLIYGIQILWLPINGVITLPPSIGQLVTILIVLVTVCYCFYLCICLCNFIRPQTNVYKFSIRIFCYIWFYF